MDKEKKYLIDILKAFIKQEPISRREGIDWKKIKYLSDIHSVSGIVGYVAKQNGLCTREEGLDEFWNCCKTSLFVYTQRASRMQELSKKMQAAQIDHILFKGYVVRNYYPVPELRTYGDIDFVIHLEDRQKSHALMLENGYQVKTDWEAVYSYYKDMEYYEIHSDIMEIDVTDRADYQGYFKQMWDHVVRVDDYVWEFTPEYHFIYLLTHIAKHIYGSGAGVRMYLDLAAFILHFQDTIDWAYIQEELQKLKLYEFCCVALTAVERWFGVKNPMPGSRKVNNRPVEIELTVMSPEKKSTQMQMSIDRPVGNYGITDELLEEFLDFTLDGGVFGHVNRESGVNVLKHASEKEKSSRFKLVLKRLFPPASQIESRYTYLQNRHWLLLVAWLHRMLKVRKELPQYRHEADVILSADSAEAERLKRLSEEIGL